MRTTRTSVDHGQQHLAHVFGLAVFAVGELDLVDLGDAFDDVGDLIAEAGFNFLVGGGRVFDRVVQQAGGDGASRPSSSPPALRPLQADG